MFYRDYIVPHGVIPIVTSVAPTAGALAGGTALAIHGTGFQTGAVVYINGKRATSVVRVTAILITCVTPASVAGAADISVYNPSQTSSLGTGFGLYTYEPAPVVTAITPNSGTHLGGTPITNLAGTGFISGATVTIGGVAATAVVHVSATKITCTTPAHGAGVVDVVVTNPDTQTSGASGHNLFTFT